MTSKLFPVHRGKDFFSSECGRFDLMLTRCGDWLVIDWERGQSSRGERDGCEVWAKWQATNTRAA